MNRSKPLRTVLAALALLLLGGAFAQDVTYTIRGTTFDGPAQIPAGMTQITIQNEEERHDSYALISLDSGRTVEEFFETMGMLFAGELMVVPGWIHFHGGGELAPSGSHSYSTFLSPGDYYLASIGQDEEGPLAMRGLVMPVSVTADEPHYDLSVTLQEYEFVIDGQFRAGTQTIRVHNAGTQPHELIMIPLPEGVTLEEMMAMEEGAMEEGHEGHEGEAAPEGPPPGMTGLWVIDPGVTAYVTVDLMTGTYGILCFVPDADGPHAMQGMMQEVAVQ